MDNPKVQSPGYSDGYNPLMMKAEEGDLEEVIQLLADLRQTDPNAVNRNNSTALALAAKSGHYKIVEVLLQSGADPNIRNNSGQSALFLACWNNFQDIVRLLLDHGAEVNTRDQRGWTPLMIAAFNGHKDIVKLLVERNADISIKDCFGKTAHDRTKDPQILRLLQNSTHIAKKYSEVSEAQKSGIFLLSSSPKKVYTIDQLSALLKKASPLKESQDYRGGLNQSATKTPTGTLRKNHSLISSQLQFSNEKIVGAFEKNDYLTPQNQGREPIGFRKNSDPKIATRFARIREERSLNSAEKSYRMTSRSPTKSAVLSSRHQKESPNRPRDTRGTRGTSTSTYSEVKKQAMKQDIEKDLIGQVEQVSDKVQGLVFQRISLEVPRHMQNFEKDLKTDLNSLFQFRVDNMFKTLHAAFNLKVKFCLNKMGYDTTSLDLTPFEESDPSFVHPDHKLFTDLPTPNYDYGKEENAIERDIYKLERSVSRGLLVDTEQSINTNYGNIRESAKPGANRFGIPNRNEIVSDLLGQLGQEVRQSTEYLMEFSNGKIHDVMREETNRIYQKMTGALNKNMDVIEEDFKKNFEDMVTQKVSDLFESLVRPPPSASAEKISPELTPSKQLMPSFTKASEKKITFSQDLGSVSKEEKLAYSSELSNSAVRSAEPYSTHISQKLTSSADFTQTRTRLSKLKDSLNFIDENKEPVHEGQEEVRHREREQARDVSYSSQLDRNVLIQDNTQQSIQEEESRKQPSFMDSIKKEYYDNIQAAAKLEELKTFYQKKSDKISVSKGEPDVATQMRYKRDQVAAQKKQKPAFK